MAAQVIQLRIALTIDDHEAAVAFYRDGLGMNTAAIWTGEQGKAVMLDGGVATLELFDERQADSVDAIEVGQRVSGPVRLALEVADIDAAIEQALAHGGELVHAPVITPWGDRNARLRAPDGLQITLFQAVGAEG